MQLFKLSIITSTALLLTVAPAAEEKQSRSANTEKSAPSTAPVISDGKIDLVISGMT